MKSLRIIALGLLFVGCSSAPPRPVALTADRATLLACQLANQEALTLYDCQPFSDGSPARFVQGRWVWGERRGWGYGDIEASVTLAADGSKPAIEVTYVQSTVLW